MQRFSVRVAKHLSAMTIRSRIILALKGIALFAIAMLMLSGRPPSRAQERMLSAEDTKQDVQIENLKETQSGQVAFLSTLQATVIDQGKDIAAIDTKITMVGWIIGFLQAAGIGFMVFPKRKAGS